MKGGNLGIDKRIKGKIRTTDSRRESPGVFLIKITLPCNAVRSGFRITSLRARISFVRDSNLYRARWISNKAHVTCDRRKVKSSEKEGDRECAYVYNSVVYNYFSSIACPRLERARDQGGRQLPH